MKRYDIKKDIKKIKNIIFKTMIYSMTFTMSFSMLNIDNNLLVSAVELSTYDQNRMLGATAMDWQSSNIREWLNSDQSIVNYTALKPSYSTEQGFLSNTNFTQAERNAIAVTKHGASNQYSLGGNVNDTSYISQRSVAHNDYCYNDKVFILNYTDIANYIERNKELMNLNKKYFSNYLQQITNKKDKYDYVVNSGYYNGGYTGCSYLYTSTLIEVSGRYEQNIVPALSLNPNYILSNGVIAKNLTIGSTVTFGKYNGEPIAWQVINKSDDGYPLLWSSKILTRKEYDAQGDINPNTSNYINYPNANVDIFSGSGQAKSWQTQTNIDSVPVINFTNESVLTTPTNNTSITLNISVTDSKYSIKKITLPDGRIVNGNYAQWTLTKNGEYDIIAENSIGVMSVRHIITKAINTPATVEITMDKDSSTKWANRPVTVTVSASNNGVYTTTAFGNRNMGYSNSNASAFPSWVSLGGKTLHITGTLKNVMTNAEASQVDMSACIRVRLSMTWYNSSQVGWTWPEIDSYTLQDLKNRGQINIDKMYTIPSNAYNYVLPYVTFMDGNSAYMKSPYNYWMSDFKFEVMEKDDLKVLKIFLPDGSSVASDHASYVIAKDGSYTFSALDNRGKTTSKTIDIAMDTIAPTVEITNSQNNFTATPQASVLHIKALDNASGIKSIKLPNGEYRTNATDGQPLSTDYNIYGDGNYTFEVLDYAGNKTVKTITVNNVDKTAPTATITQNPTSWTNDKTTLEIDASDSQSGVDFITLPDGKIVKGNTANYTATQNKTYTFLVTDKIGNILSKSYTVNSIDSTAPTLILTKTVNWSNSSVTISVTAVDKESGVKQIILPDKNIINDSTATFTINNIGVYYFSSIDNVGNVGINYIVVDNIDKNKPTVTIINNKNWSNASSEGVTITATDK